MKKIATLVLLIFMLGATPAMALTSNDNILGFAFDLVSDSDQTLGMDSQTPEPTSMVPTPIPGAVWLLGTGLVGLVGLRRRFRS